MLAGIPKKALRRYLYEFRVPLRWKNVGTVVNACIRNVFGDQTPPLSKQGQEQESLKIDASPQTLLAIKRALEAYRKREGKSTRLGMQSEAALLETAAEKGDPSAIALLCGSRFNDSEEDQNTASQLLRDLMDRRFPLAYKVSGDVAYRLGQISQAQQFWKLALDSGLKDARMRIECWRGIGHVAFRDAQLFAAREAFMHACQEADATPGGNRRQTADCHYFLAQLREADRLVARYHLEVAAGFGLSDAFVPLGSLLLNWFGEANLAREWFELALATDKTGAAALGLFDAAGRLGDVTLARRTLQRIRARGDAEILLKSRQKSVDRLTSANSTNKPFQNASPNMHSPNMAKPGRDRWDF